MRMASLYLSKVFDSQRHSAVQHGESSRNECEHLGPCERTSLRVSNKQGPPGTEDCPMLDPSGTSPWLLVGTLAARLVG